MFGKWVKTYPLEQARQMRLHPFNSALFGQYTIIIRFVHLLISVDRADDDVFGRNAGLSCHDILDLGPLCVR